MPFWPSLKPPWETWKIPFNKSLVQYSSDNWAKLKAQNPVLYKSYSLANHVITSSRIVSPRERKSSLVPSKLKSSDLSAAASMKRFQANTLFSLDSLVNSGCHSFLQDMARIRPFTVFVNKELGWWASPLQRLRTSFKSALPLSLKEESCKRKSM